MKNKAFTLIAGLGLLISACTYNKLEPRPDCLQPIKLEVQNLINSSCGLATGSFELAEPNTEPRDNPIRYSLDGTNFQDNGLFTGLAAGTYTAVATDDLCRTEIQVVIENEDGLNADIQVSPSACGSSTGSIAVSVTGAIGEARYALNNGVPQAEPVFNGLSPGIYELTITDDSGCRIELEGTVRSEVEFAEVERIIQNSCAISGCHAGNISPDFRVRENIINRAGRIQARTSSQTMPPRSSGLTLTQAEIDAISCWVDDGAPN